jgi:hypothetical protein
VSKREGKEGVESKSLVYREQSGLGREVWRGGGNVREGSKSKYTQLPSLREGREGKGCVKSKILAYREHGRLDNRA